MEIFQCRTWRSAMPSRSVPYIRALDYREALMDWVFEATNLTQLASANTGPATFVDTLQITLETLFEAVREDPDE